MEIGWKDNFRMKITLDETNLSQAQSQTSNITAYTIHHQPWFTISYAITILDTPGFGDTAGIERDKEITDQICSCFQAQSPDGVDHVDAVGFVAHSALPRVTPVQRYIFDSILSLFGKDIGDNIFMLLTFAAGQNPQALSGTKVADISYKKFLKFNNSALFMDNAGIKEEDLIFNEMFWKMGAKASKFS